MNMEASEGLIVQPRKIRRRSPDKQEYTVHGISGEHFICFDDKGIKQFVHWHNLTRFELIE